ncbi:MAG: nucleotidyltransferase family protein [Chloroflexi bacterium]|nr:nucleotidyltransferase family protein [Chloroflexota bacterium]
MTDPAKTVPSLDDLRARRDEILELARRHRAYNVRVFGSVARGDATPESDIDVLVAFRPGASLFDLSALWQDLQDLLDREVNVVSEGGMNERFRQRIADDVVPL